MNLKAHLSALQNESRKLPLVQRAQLSCQIARQFERAGEYEAAREALGEFWPEDFERPIVAGLAPAETAEVLLRVGALAGWLGSTRQAEGSQETAKNLITRSMEMFEALGQPERVAEARGDLALCYWREGAYDEARIHLARALDEVAESNSELRAILLIRAGIVEVWSQRLTEASRLYNEAAPLLDTTNDHVLKGAFHDELAVLFTKLSEGLNSKSYVDRALIEYSAASFHFEQAGHIRYRARVENNLGYLFFSVQRFREAHIHLDRARRLFLEWGDIGAAAGVEETRARTLLAEGYSVEAERIVRSAVRTLQKGGEQTMLAEALTTHGTALARLGNTERAREIFQRAIEIAEIAGDLETAGGANLSMIEELGDKFSIKELIFIYRSAIELLHSSQDPAAGKRLIECADKLLSTLALLENDYDVNTPPATWEGFSLKQHIQKGERAVIERALRDASGSVTKAAQFLGFKHHQSLISLINNRHRELLKTRSTVRRRRRHIFSESKKTKKRVASRPVAPTSQISILHVEDNEAVARVVADTLTNEGMRVDSSNNGSTALKILKGEKPYDIIIVDNSLPGLKGLDLVKRTRNMPHRLTTPIIMLSGDDLEREAWRVGVDEFLLKPEAIDQVSSVISRLLKERKESRVE